MNNFIKKINKILKKNYAFSNQIRNLDNKSITDKQKLFRIANNYISNLIYNEITY